MAETEVADFFKAEWDDALKQAYKTTNALIDHMEDYFKSNEFTALDEKSRENIARRAYLNVYCGYLMHKGYLAGGRGSDVENEYVLDEIFRFVSDTLEIKNDYKEEITNAMQSGGEVRYKVSLTMKTLGKVQQWLTSYNCDLNLKTEAEERKRLPLKYKNNTFTYWKKSIDLKSNLSFAFLCDTFYRSCPKSGKTEWKKIKEEMTQKKPEITGVDREQIRQWIRDFNRWARGSRQGFGDMLKGDLLLLKGDFIVRLK